MRTLITADIHGNAAALRAVLAEPHDRLICLGDIVGYGPRPAECIGLIRSGAGLAIRGNHDYALASGDDPRASPAFAPLARAAARIGETDVLPADREWLRRLPRTAGWKLDGRLVFAVHATPGDPLFRYLPPDAPDWEAELAGIEAGIVMVGHTHLPGLREVGGRTLINPGSVGQPKHGDPRAAYALLEDDRLTLHRRPYPVEDTVAALRAWELPPPVEAGLIAVLRTGRPDAMVPAA
ncbi:MAG: metallophosphoesterase [Gemmatimonadales bacterium]